MEWGICIIITLTILVIYLLSCYRKDCCVNSLKYGTVSQEHMAMLRKYMSKEVTEHFDNIMDFLPCPASNMSRETVDELCYLQKACNNATAEQKALAYKYDEGFSEAFFEYARSNLDGVNIDDLKRKLGEVSAICMLIKLHYNRPRPYQLGAALNIPIYPLKSVTAHTPSYISGHTCQAYYLAWRIGKLHPDHKDRLVALAETVRKSREYGGWHFPSDNIGAILVAKYLAEYFA